MCNLLHNLAAVGGYLKKAFIGKMLRPLPIGRLAKTRRFLLDSAKHRNPEAGAKEFDNINDGLFLRQRQAGMDGAQRAAKSVAVGARAGRGKQSVLIFMQVS